MTLQADVDYFIAKEDVFLRKNATGGKAINHLILGDWLRFTGEQQGQRIKVKCRGDVGWINDDDIGEQRALEVNFVDIGQGDGCHIVTPEDQIILIDAGVGTNMERFLSWRYNLRGRNVKRAPDFDDTQDEQKPWLIDYVVISHPDNDHYLGFRSVFDNPKLRFDRIFHNGIVERPIVESDKDPDLVYISDDDLGGYVDTNPKYLWDLAHTDLRLKEIVNAHPDTRKQLISTYRACLKNSDSVEFKSLNHPRETIEQGERVFMDKFDGSSSLLTLEVLGPVTEKITHNGKTRDCLRKLGAEGVTKNGHSIVFRLEFGKLAVMLGGDLNTQAQDFLLNSYANAPARTSSLEKKIIKLESMGVAISDRDKEKLAKTKARLNEIINLGRSTFQCDIAKACHHGSSHVMNAFLSVINPVATVISSGDEESHSHPRPDALGSFGKHGRGRRPLIFSTELARSTREFTPVIKFLNQLRAFEAAIEAEPDPTERKRIQHEMENKRDRNVVVYGMITLRALGDKVVIAQKLEEPRSNGTKWDIYKLHRNENTGLFEYVAH